MFSNATLGGGFTAYVSANIDKKFFRKNFLEFFRVGEGVNFKNFLELREERRDGKPYKILIFFELARGEDNLNNTPPIAW